MTRLLPAAMMALVSASALAAPPSCDSLSGLRWLLGDWVADGNKKTLHESWTEVTPQTFEGTGIERAKPDGTISVSEVLRLVEMAGGVFYVSKVADNELPVAFRLTQCTDGRFVFDNPAHDFPRRLEYLLLPDGRLAVHVSDGGEKGFRLSYSRSSSPGDPAPVLVAEDARFAAMVAADTGQMRHWFADDLVYVHSTGLVESRDQLIESITSGRIRYLAVTPVERQVVPLGPAAAAVRGRGRFQVTADGNALDLQIRYLAVYGSEGGVWRLRSWQSLRTP
jgi:hypothetical protein